MKEWNKPELDNLLFDKTKSITGCEYSTSTFNPRPNGNYDKCAHHKDGYCYHPNYGAGNPNGSSAVEHWPCPKGPSMS